MSDIVILNKTMINGESYFLGVWPKKANKIKNLYLFGKEKDVSEIASSKNCGTLTQVISRLKDLIVPKQLMQMFIEDELTVWYEECLEILSGIKEW